MNLSRRIRHKTTTDMRNRKENDDIEKRTDAENTGDSCCTSVSFWRFRNLEINELQKIKSIKKKL